MEQEREHHHEDQLQKAVDTPDRTGNISSQLRKDLNIATGTMTKLRRNEEVALSVLLRICEYLDCNIGDICDAVKTPPDHGF